MDIIFVSKRIINDVAPIIKKNKYKKLMDSNLFISICEMFYNKEINNIQFRTKIGIELSNVNMSL